MISEALRRPMPMLRMQTAVDSLPLGLAPADHGLPGGDPGPEYRPGGFSRTPGSPEYLATGIVGEAKLATTEKGRKVIEIMTREWVRAPRASATVPVGER